MIKFIEVSASAILWVTAAVSFLPMPEAQAVDRMGKARGRGSRSAHSGPRRQRQCDTQLRALSQVIYTVKLTGLTIAAPAGMGSVACR